MQALMRDEPPHLHSQAFGCLKGRKTAACVRCSANCSSLITCGQAAVSGQVWGLWKRLRRPPVATCRAPAGHSSQTHLPCSAPWELGLHKFPHVSSCKDSETSHSGYRGNKIVAQGSVVTSCAVPRTTDGNLYSQQNCCY